MNLIIGLSIWETARTHYSSLNQINTSNVSDLEISWIYNSGDLEKIKKLKFNVVQL